jgi:hypothetical protein
MIAIFCTMPFLAHPVRDLGPGRSACGLVTRKKVWPLELDTVRVEVSQAAARQWQRKVGLEAPKFAALRSGLSRATAWWLFPLSLEEYGFC